MSEVLVVAGEPSGDQLAGELVAAAREVAPGARFFGATGPGLEAAGAERIVATSDLAVMGLVEVAGRIPSILRSLRALEAAAVRRRPAGAILVDSPDFNLRLARRLARRGIPVVQVVSPTVWAWRPRRVRAIERSVTRLLLTLPFEARTYAGTGVDAVYVGNPVADRVPRPPPPRAVVAERIGADPAAPWVALAPGSRAAELARMGPLFAAAARAIRRTAPTVELIVPVAPGLAAVDVAAALAGGPPVRLVEEARLEALAHARAAIVTSGTASLELAALCVPHVVAYRAHPVTMAAARLLVRVDRIALPNLVAGRDVVPEFIQRAATPEAVAAPVRTWLADPAARAAAAAALAEVGAAIGPPGVARRAAAAALDALGLAPVGTFDKTSGAGDLAEDATRDNPSPADR